MLAIRVCVCVCVRACVCVCCVTRWLHIGVQSSGHRVKEYSI